MLHPLVSANIWWKRSRAKVAVANVGITERLVLLVNIPMMILNRIRSVFGRPIFPASCRLPARFLCEGVPSPPLIPPGVE